LGLWTGRRADNMVSIAGLVPLKLEEVLAWRDIKKSQHAFQDATGQERTYSWGYHSGDKERVRNDLELLSCCCVYGDVTTFSKGKLVQITFNHAYLHYQPVSTQGQATSG